MSGTSLGNYGVSFSSSNSLNSGGNNNTSSGNLQDLGTDQPIAMKQKLWTRNDVELLPSQTISSVSVEVVEDAGTNGIIGHGAGGLLRKCTLKDRPGFFALKTISQENMRDRHVCSEFFNEIRVLSRIDHPHCVKFIGAGVTPPHLFMVTEFLGGGTLYDMIHHHPNRFNRIGVFRIARDLASAMAYLHQQNIIHRDLKSSNIMFSEKSSLVKIIDFGLSRGVSESMTGETGSYRWMAPEVIRHRPYTEKCDVFSYAVVLYELFSKEVPFRELTPVQAAIAVTEGQRPKIPAICKPEVAAMIKLCWDKDPEKRPPFTDIFVVMNQHAQAESQSLEKQKASIFGSMFTAKEGIS